MIELCRRFGEDQGSRPCSAELLNELIDSENVENHEPVAPAKVEPLIS
jgi:hypothetical protein